MSRVLLIGRGPLPSPTVRHTGFAQLRTRHFLRVLQDAGHEVDLLLLDSSAQADHAPELLEDARQRARHAHVVVSAGPHRPGQLAVAAAGETPLWVDVPGDPLAELDALVRAPGPPIARWRTTSSLAATHAVLARADALSVMSTAQRHATFGRLSLLGRFIGEDAPVHVVPIAFDFPGPRGTPRGVPATGARRLLLMGAAAPWLDDTNLTSGLELALRQDSRLHVILTGGGVALHYDAGGERIATWARTSTVRDRVDHRGWVSHAELDQVLGDAHVAVCLDTPGPEPELGSRTRLLHAAWAGLHIAASPTTELVADLADRGLATALPRDPAALAHTLCTLAPSAQRVSQCFDHLATEYDPHAILAPLLEFVAAPTRAPATETPEASLAAQVEELRAELARVHASPTWRVLSRLHRLIQR